MRRISIDAIAVLIVEDESLIRWSLRQEFELIGYEVTEADRRDEALSSLGTDIYGSCARWTKRLS